jgi:hypothetical protein
MMFFEPATLTRKAPAMIRSAGLDLGDFCFARFVLLQYSEYTDTYILNLIHVTVQGALNHLPMHWRRLYLYMFLHLLVRSRLDFLLALHHHASNKWCLSNLFDEAFLASMRNVITCGVLFHCSVAIRVNGGQVEKKPHTPAHTQTHTHTHS